MIPPPFLSHFLICMLGRGEKMYALLKQDKSITCVEGSDDRIEKIITGRIRFWGILLCRSSIKEPAKQYQ